MIPSWPHRRPALVEEARGNYPDARRGYQQPLETFAPTTTKEMATPPPRVAGASTPRPPASRGIEQLESVIQELRRLQEEGNSRKTSPAASAGGGKVRETKLRDGPQEGDGTDQRQSSEPESPFLSIASALAAAATANSDIDAEASLDGLVMSAAPPGRDLRAALHAQPARGGAGRMVRGKDRDDGQGEGIELLMQQVCVGGGLYRCDGLV